MRELLTAIGLEALYHNNNAGAIAAGGPILSREIFVRGKMMLLVTPPELLRMLAAQVMFEWFAPAAPAPEKRLKLVH